MPLGAQAAKQKSRPQAPEPTLSERHLALQAGRLALPVALCCILIGAFRIAATWRQLSLTWDEPYHFHAGLQYLVHHTRTEAEQPPLAQAAAAFAAFRDGIVPPARLDRDLFLRNLLLESRDPWRVIVRMRAGELPFFCLTGLVVFWAARRYFGTGVALVSTALFTLVPSVLAHAGLATTDISVVATLSTAFFTLLWWAERPGWLRAAALGAAAGVMVLSKFSNLGFLPAAAALALVSYAAVERPGRAALLSMARERAPSFGLAVAVGACVIWAGYLFTFGPVPSWHSGVSVPAPELFEGIHVAAEHNRLGHDSYLLGEHGHSGWWYFFPVVLAVKTPIALLALAAFGLVACWHMRRRGGLLPVAFCLGILLPAMTSHINLGVRHVLPIYVGMAIMGGLGAAQLARWMRGAGLLAPLVPAALITWMAWSGARAHPDYLTYFNEFGGDRPDRILLDSDLDWCQDLVLVGRRLRELGASQVRMHYYPDYATPEVFRRLYGVPAEPQGPHAGEVTPGWNAIGVTALRALGGGEYQPPAPLPPGFAGVVAGPWYQRIRPVDRVGGYVLFYIPADFR